MIRPDAGGVQVAVHIDLGAAEEGVVQHAAAGCFHDLGHGAGHEGLPGSPGITDGDGHLGDQGSSAARFEQDNQVRRVGLLGQHGGRAGSAGADADGSTVFEFPRRGADHQFHCVVVCHNLLSPPF